MGGDTNGRRFIYVPTNFIRNAGDPVQRQQTQAGEATRWSEEDDEDGETVGGRDTLEITARVTREANSAYWCERNLSGQPGSSGGSADNDGGRRGVPVGVYRRLAERVPGDEARLVVHERTGRSVFVTRGLGPSEAGDDVMDSSDGGGIADSSHGGVMADSSHGGVIADSSNGGGIADISNGGVIADSSDGGVIADSNAGVHMDRGSGDEDTENFSCNLEYSSDITRDTDGMTSLSEQTSFAVAESRSVDALPTTPRTANETTSDDCDLVINPTSISQTTNPPPARLSTSPVPTSLRADVRNSVTSTTRPLSLINRIPLSSTPPYQSALVRGLLQSPPVANPTPSSHPFPNPTPSSHPIPNPTPSSHPFPNPTPSSHPIPPSDNISPSDFVHPSQPPMPPLRTLQLNNSPNHTNSTHRTPSSHSTRTPTSHSTHISQRTPLRIVPSLLSDHRIATTSPQLPTRPSSSHTSISSRSPASRCHRRSGSESRRVGPVPLLTLRRSSALPPRDATVPAADSTRNRSIVISEFPGI